MKRLRCGLWIIMFTYCLTGCGYKTSPHPAAATVPGPVGIADVHAYPNRVELRWSVPSANVDGSALKDLSGFKVYRVAQEAGESCENCEERKSLYANVDFQNPTNARIGGGEVLYTDGNVSAGNVYSYWVGAYNLKGREGRVSDEITVSFDQFPPAPKDLRATEDPKGVVLDWEPLPAGEGIRSYRVYRGVTDNPEEMKPVGGTGSGGTTYMDREVEKEKPYFYTVRSLRVARGVTVESPPSVMVRGMLPAVQWQPPEKVDAVSTREGMRICWDKVEIENEDTRYNIYRSETGKMFEKLNREGLVDLCYLDTRVERGKSYRYAVTAFPSGKLQDESGRSASEAVKFTR